MGQYIHPDQTGFMKGRQLKDRHVKENVRRVLNLINYVHTLKSPTLLYFVDTEKAFDHVEWLYLKELLIFTGLGQYFPLG